MRPARVDPGESPGPSLRRRSSQAGGAPHTPHRPTLPARTRPIGGRVCVFRPGPWPRPDRHPAGVAPPRCPLWGLRRRHGMARSAPIAGGPSYRGRTPTGTNGPRDGGRTYRPRRRQRPHDRRRGTPRPRPDGGPAGVWVPGRDWGGVERVRRSHPNLRGHTESGFTGPGGGSHRDPPGPITPRAGPATRRNSFLSARRPGELLPGPSRVSRGRPGAQPAPADRAGRHPADRGRRPARSAPSPQCHPLPSSSGQPRTATSPVSKTTWTVAGWIAPLDVRTCTKARSCASSVRVG